MALLAENNNFKGQVKRFLWEGWSSKLLLNNSMDIDCIKRYLISLTKEERFFVFSGIGEAISKKSKDYLSISRYFNDAKKSILEAMDSDEKSYFYQGLGRGLVRLYCSNVYSAKGPYMANKELFYCYLQLIDKSNIENFIDGFLTRELWQPL